MVLFFPARALAQGCAGCGGCPASQQAAAKTAAPAEDEHCHWLEVKSVVADNPAAVAGVLAGDVLVSYNGRTVGCMNDFNLARATVRSESVVVVFRRGDKDMNFLLPAGKLGVYFNEWQKDVVPDKDAKVIKGVPSLSWESGKTNSFMGALEAVLVQQGVKYDYTFLSGVSGAAFRTHFFDTWCPSSPDATVGYNSAEAALAACGYEVTPLSVSGDGKNKPQVLAAIVKSIDAGMPVLAIDLIDMPEWGVITGYQKKGAELLCRSYFDKRKGYELAQKFPFMVYVLKKTGKAPDARASIRKSFAIVKENLTTPKYGEYHSGLAAFETWMARLTTTDFTSLDSAALTNVIQANYWTYSRVIDDRKTGMAWLDRVAKELPATAATTTDLKKLYEQEVDYFAPVLESLPCPGSVTRGDQWEPPVRMKQIMSLMQARQVEEQALAKWQALAAKD